MEFLDVLETIRAEQASVHRLFGDAGESTRSVSSRTRRRDPHYPQKLLRAVDLIESVYNGRRDPFYLKEAMSTSDFPLLFADVMDRQLLAAYQAAQPAWQKYCKRSTVSDFRTVKRFAIDGGDTTLSPVGQNAEYPEAALTETPFNFAVGKYGRKIAFSWETMINDDLGAFRDVPTRLARAAVYSEDKFATELHADTNGPHATVYTVGHGNIVTSNPVLSIASVTTAKSQLSSRRDVNGNPIVMDRYVLEVCPQQETTAMGIMNAVQLLLNENGGAANSQIVTTNWVPQRVTLVVNYWLPIVAATAVAAGHYPWFLHGEPNMGRPAYEMGFLRGHEQPEIFQQIANAQRVGGSGTVLESFENDAVNHKVRHVFGGVAIDYRCTVGSNGSGS